MNTNEQFPEEIATHQTDNTSKITATITSIVKTDEVTQNIVEKSKHKRNVLNSNNNMKKRGLLATIAQSK